MNASYLGKGIGNGESVPGRRKRVCRGLETRECETKPGGATAGPAEL